MLLATRSRYNPYTTPRNPKFGVYYIYMYTANNSSLSGSTIPATSLTSFGGFEHLVSFYSRGIIHEPIIHIYEICVLASATNLICVERFNIV